jgi:predicted DNA-binding transcriptional regulator AlpA
MLNELLNQRQAAARLGLGSPRTLESWRLRGFGPAFVRLSSRLVRYRVSDLDEWIAARVVGAGVTGSTTGACSEIDTLFLRVTDRGAGRPRGNR